MLAGKTKHKRTGGSVLERCEKPGASRTQSLLNIYPSKVNGLRENGPIIEGARSPPHPLPQFFDLIARNLQRKKNISNLRFKIQNTWVNSSSDRRLGPADGCPSVDGCPHRRLSPPPADGCPHRRLPPSPRRWLPPQTAAPTDCCTHRRLPPPVPRFVFKMWV